MSPESASSWIPPGGSLSRPTYTARAKAPRHMGRPRRGVLVQWVSLCCRQETMIRDGYSARVRVASLCLKDYSPEDIGPR